MKEECYIGKHNYTDFGKMLVLSLMLFFVSSVVFEDTWLVTIIFCFLVHGLGMKL